MQNNKLIITLTEVHRGGTKSFSFSGRPNGKEVRGTLQLDQKDFDNNNYLIKMPSDTTSFNPSFYLGLLFESVENLKGLEEMKKKYEFDLYSIDDAFRDLVQEDLLDCERVASNEYDNLKQ